MKKLQEIDILNITISELESIYSQCILQHRRKCFNSKPGGLFRIRKISSHEQINSTKQIWYRDWAEVSKEKYVYNRCSDKGQNFFYGSNSLKAAIKEVRPQHDELLLIGVFEIKYGHKLMCQLAGIELLKNKPQFKDDLREFHYKSARDKQIEIFIGNQFKMEVKENELYKYKHSIAFTNILLKNDEFDCLIYPSVASNLNFYNFGIKAKSVDNKLICRDLYIYKYEEHDSKIHLTPLKYGKFDFSNQTHPKFWTLTMLDAPSKEIIKYDM